METMGGSEPRGDGQEEEAKSGTSEGLEEQPGWLTKEGMKQLQPGGSEDHPKAESGEVSDEKKLPSPLDPRACRAERMEVQQRSARLLVRKQSCLS